MKLLRNKKIISLLLLGFGILIYLLHKNKFQLKEVYDALGFDDNLIQAAEEIKSILMSYTDDFDKLFQNSTILSEVIETLNNSSSVIENLSDMKMKLLQNRDYIHHFIQKHSAKVHNMMKAHTGNESFTPIEDIITQLGYCLEIHHIITFDGYVLKAFRIQGKKQSHMVPLKKVVYLQHGLVDSSDAFIANYEHSTPAFMLANAGYDVWIGNMRGNKHSRAHIKYNPDIDESYWDFTWQHMSEYDLPSIVTYIHLQTHLKVNYIGHSQGGLVMIAALAEKIPEIENLTENIFTLSPVIFMNNPDTKLFKIAANSDIHKFLTFFNFKEIFEANHIANPSAAFLCSLVKDICNELISFMSDADSGIINKERLSVWLGHYPSGTSVKNIFHFRQMLLEAKPILRKYNYGPTKNMLVYGATEPPVINIEEIDKRIYIYAGTLDKMSSVGDIREGARRIKTVVYKEIEAGHLSFILGTNMEYMEDIIGIINLH